LIDQAMLWLAIAYIHDLCQSGRRQTL